MNKEDQKILYLFEAYPETKESNTELYARMIEEAYKQRSGEELPQLAKDLLRIYKAESVTRRRRKLKKGTSGQYAEEVRYREEYKH